MLYGAAIIAFALGYLIFAIIWLYIVWRENCCLWPGLTHLCYVVWREYYCLWTGLPHVWQHMVVRRVARVLLPLAWVNCSLLSYG